MYDKLYSDIADALVKEGYLVINNALPLKLFQALFKIATDENLYKKAGISNTSNLHIDSTKRSDKTKWIDEDGDAQSQYLDFSNGLQNYLNRSLYLGLNYYESHFALYEKGSFYEKHLDSFKNSKNRVVTTVYYLNEDWSQNDGGELIMYNEDGLELRSVTPNANTLVVFLSDKFEHEVLKANKKRYSIAGWFRVDKI